MKKILELLSEEAGKAFAEAGYDKGLGKVIVSNRPDLCEFQCNGAMAGAKLYKKAPVVIAGDVAEKLKESKVFSEVSAVNPGFLNLKISNEFLADFIRKMRCEEKFGLEKPAKPKKIIIDYGGANVAKPLHVGHLRPAIIGESVKRICRYAGHEVIGDVHLGDWGLQMGLVIMGLKERKPDLVYFDETYEGEYPAKAPFTISELEEIYPAASAKSKEDAEFKAQAMEATRLLQQGQRGYRALWKHIMNVSVTDLKKNYGNLNVEFDLWKGESDVNDLIPEMVDYMKEGGYAHVSEGALVVDVKEETDTKEMPPCMILKSDGSSLYNTTDLATIMARMREYEPDQIIYVVDKRQSLYFEQVFRCARKTKLVNLETELTFIGFGTMNGADGKPFKTRDGGVMRLENLVRDTDEEMYRKIKESAKNRGDGQISEEEARETAQIVGLAALKYGDLSNQAAKDYVFDIDRFTSSEGNTGPYILYTIVRIKSILAKYWEQVSHDGSAGAGTADAGEKEVSGNKDSEGIVRNSPTEDREKLFAGLALGNLENASEKELCLLLAQFNAMMESAAAELAPHKICGYIYDVANAFNHFYHETKILSEQQEERKKGLIALLILTRDVLNTCIGLLGFAAPERM